MEALAREAAKRARAKTLIDESFGVQRAFIEDPTRLKAALCTRRSGKTYAAGIYLFNEMLTHPGCTVLFVGLHFRDAKRILFKDVLRDLDRKRGLNAAFNESEGSVRLPNGSILYVIGVDSSPEAKDKALGQKYRLVVVDEAASYRIDLQDFVYRILKPAVADYLGTICLIGTPGNRKNFFYDVTQPDEKLRAPGWSVHRWTFEDNPSTVNQVRQDVVELLAANPLYVETPAYRQMYLGEWAVDESKLVYRFNTQRNLLTDEEASQVTRGALMQHVIGMDIGYHPDPTAWVVVGWQPHNPTLYVRYVHKQTMLDADATAAFTRNLMELYDPIDIVVDNMNKSFVDGELKYRLQLPLSPAEQHGKVDAIGLLNSDLITGRIKLMSGTEPLQEEWEELVWHEKVLPHRHVEHPGCANHLSDAMLYAWRRSRNFVETPRPNARRKTLDELADEMFERTLARVQREKDPYLDVPAYTLDEDESW